MTHPAVSQVREPLIALCLIIPDEEFDEYDKPGAERSRRRRGGGDDDDLDR